MSSRGTWLRQNYLDPGIQGIPIGALCDIPALPLTPSESSQPDLSPEPPSTVSAMYNPANGSARVDLGQSSSGSSRRHLGINQSTETDLQANSNPTARTSGANYRKRQTESRDKAFTTKVSSQSPRKRGRPGKSDEADSSVDKRRVQIRVAQRAYRSRQKAHMSLMEARIRGLETTVDLMAKNFLSFNDKVMQSGILERAPGLAKDFRQTSEEFLRLVKNAVEFDTDKVHNVPKTADSSEQARGDGTRYDAGQSRDSDIATANSNLLDGLDDTDVPMLTNRPRTPDKGASVRCPRPTPDELSSCSSTRAMHPVSPTWADDLDPAVSKLNGPNSASFAERLLYACAQRGYHFLNDPTVSSPSLYRVFGLLMSTMTRSDIMAYLEARLKYPGSHEAFGSWNIPMFSIGGAGTHRRRNFSRIDNPYTPSLSAKEEEACTDTSPFMSEDEWFDAKDVEGFLEEREVNINRQRSDPHISEETASGALEFARLDMPRDRIQSSSNQRALGRLRLDRPLVIDEALLIDSLTSLCICLGHTVGFRRRDIESVISRYARPVTSPYQDSTGVFD